MSRHWHPGSRSSWTVVDGYAPPARAPRRVAMLLAGSLIVGLAGGAAWHWRPRPAAASGPDAPIEWYAVQAVPTRALTPDEIAWEKRGELQPSPSWGGLGGGAAPADAGDADKEFSSPADAGGPPPCTRMDVRGTSKALSPGQGCLVHSPTRGEASYARLYVIDGDTFGIGGERIRIAGIDAPETHPARCAREAELGNAATRQLKALLGSGTLTITGTAHDRYGRELRRVEVNGEDVGEAMIAAGLARSYSGGKKLPWC